MPIESNSPSRGPKKQRNNRSGFVGIHKHRNVGRTGKVYHTWQVSWTDRTGKNCCTNFGFKSYGGEKEAFQAALRFRLSKELECYGKMSIPLSKSAKLLGMSKEKALKLLQGKGTPRNTKKKIK